MNLPFDDHWVDNVPKIIGGSKAFYCYLTGIWIHFHLTRIGSSWISEVLWVIKSCFFKSRLYIFNRKIMRNVSFQSHITKRNCFIGSSYRKNTFIKVYFIIRCFHHMSCYFLPFRDNFFNTSYNSGTANC